MSSDTNLRRLAVCACGAVVFALALVAAAQDGTAAASDTVTQSPAKSTASGDQNLAKASDSTADDGVNRFDGKPYKIYPDGKVDHATWLGSRLYGNMCFHCHGDNGNGSSFAPSLHDALQTMSYEDFVATVANGRTQVDSANTKVMPTFGENKTIMENLDGIYAYLKAASNNALPHGELQWKGPKNE